MKTIVNYLVLFLLGVILLSCNGKTGKQQSTLKKEIAPIKDSLVSKDITGEMTEKPLNDIFFESVLFEVIRGSLGAYGYFFLQNKYIHFASVLPNFEFNGNAKYFSIKESQTQNATNSTWVIDKNTTQETQISYDNKGFVTNVKSPFGDINFLVTYLPNTSTKFESIILNLSVPNLPSTRLDFKYNNTGVLQSIFLYNRSSKDAEFKKIGQRDFLNYEHGIMIGSAFYSFYESEPSKLHQLLFPGQLLYTNSIDNNGNQYYIINHQTGSDYS